MVYCRLCGWKFLYTVRRQQSPHSIALFNIYLSKAQHFAPNWSFVSNVKHLYQPITSDVIYYIGAPTVYRRIYRHKFLTLSNQISHNIRKCIRMVFDPVILLSCICLIKIPEDQCPLTLIWDLTLGQSNFLTFLRLANFNLLKKLVIRVTILRHLVSENEFLKDLTI